MADDLAAAPAGWRWTTVRDLSERVTVGYVGPTREHFCPAGHGVRLVRSQNIRPGRLVLDDVEWVTRAFHEANPKSQLAPGDVLVTRVGANAGDVCVVPRDAGELHCSSAVFSRPQPRHSKYLEVFFRSPLGQHILRTRIVGSVSERINTRDFEAMPVLLPPSQTEDAIAHILGTLDDKIDLNRRTNETLESMAQALFKSWFVDFDPVRSKAAGKQPTGMDAATAALFPSEFVESEIGEIPKGWSAVAVGEIAEVVGGSTPSTKDDAFWSGGRHSWATPKDLSTLATPVLLETERCITDAGLAQIGSGLLPVGTVLLSSRAPIGYLAIAEVPVAINQGFIAMKPRPSIPSTFLLLWARSASDEILSRANGSTFLEISKSNFRPIPVVTAPAAVLSAFDRACSPLYRRIVALERESRTLSAARDALLPRLLSGKLTIPNAERFVGAAT